MKYLKAFWKEEKGAAQMIEAVMLYPIAFLIIFLMIYLGLYILQAVTLGTYAQKTAILASRELSQPGYRHLLDSNAFSTGAIEMTGEFSNDGDYNNDTVKISSINAYGQEMSENFSVAYRYFKLGEENNPLTINKGKGRKYYEDTLEKMVRESSILSPQKSDSAVKVEITCENKFVAQYIHVHVEQELVHFPILDFFGVESPKISASAVATVSDTDELVRTTDFVADAIDSLAQRLGINTDKLRESVNKALDAIGLK